MLLPMKVDKYIFFPETCFAYTISEPEFAVCNIELNARNLIKKVWIKL